jgi:uncharacterized membrane protein
MAKKRKNQNKSGGGNREAAGAGLQTAAATGPQVSDAAQAATATPKRRSEATAPGFNALWLVLVLTGLGVLLTGYLTVVHFTNAELAACSAGSSCDLVQSSRWSTLLGVPLAIWGLLTYAAIGAIVWSTKRRPERWTWAMFAALLGVAISIYLQVISVFEIEAVCQYCVASAVLMTVIFIVLALFRPARQRNFAWNSFAPSSGLIAVAVVVVMHMHYSGTFSAAVGPESPYLKGLAEHLDDTGAKFYGAYWCPHCQQQKRMFEASVDRLPYVECSPGGRGTPSSAVCNAAGVRDYPTWVIGGKRYPGIQSPRRLAELARYKPPAS